MRAFFKNCMHVFVYVCSRAQWHILLKRAHVVSASIFKLAIHVFFPSFSLSITVPILYLFSFVAFHNNRLLWLDLFWTHSAKTYKFSNSSRSTVLLNGVHDNHHGDVSEKCELKHLCKLIFFSFLFRFFFFFFFTQEIRFQLHNIRYYLKKKFF